ARRTGSVAASIWLGRGLIKRRANINIRFGYTFQCLLMGNSGQRSILAPDRSVANDAMRTLRGSCRRFLATIKSSFRRGARMSATSLRIADAIVLISAALSYGPAARSQTQEQFEFVQWKG